MKSNKMPLCCKFDDFLDGNKTYKCNIHGKTLVISKLPKVKHTKDSCVDVTGLYFDETVVLPERFR